MKKLLTIIFFLSLWQAKAQIPVSNRQYLLNKTAIIPAMSGYHHNIESFCTYNKLWTGIYGSPQATSININAFLGNNMATAFDFNSFSTGNFYTFSIKTTYAYSLKINEKYRIAASVSPIYTENLLKISNINSFGTAIDPILANADKLSASTFDIGTSLAIYSNKLIAGFSFPYIFNHHLKLNNLTLSSNFLHTDAFISYKFFWKQWMFSPSIIIRYFDSETYLYELNLTVKYNKKIWFYGGFNSATGIISGFSVLSSNNLIISYNYSFAITGISSISGGSHEITVGFLIKPAKKFIENNTVFQPRLPVKIEIERDQELYNKVYVIDKKINKEITQRADVVQNLQRQIDSLKNILNHKNKTDNIERKILWQQEITTRRVCFSLQNDSLLNSSLSVLNAIADKMNQYKDLKIKVLVYTYDTQYDFENQKISDKRAKAIYNYLLSKGIEKQRIKYGGMGNRKADIYKKNNTVVILLNKKVF